MTFLQNRVRGALAVERLNWALERSHPRGPRPRDGGFRLFAPRRQKAASSHLYFDVRPIAAGGRQLLQYGFVDDRGNVVLSVCGDSAIADRANSARPAEDLAAEPLDAEWLSILIGTVCRDACLVTYHKVLQGGLLPPGVIEEAASIECAWRRYVRLAQRRGTFDRSEPATLDDALEAAGIGAVGAPDATLRALGVRELWAWMDKVE